MTVLWSTQSEEGFCVSPQLQLSNSRPIQDALFRVGLHASLTAAPRSEAAGGEGQVIASLLGLRVTIF